MLVSQSQELAFDQQLAPRQFSADFGPVQDASLNAYVTQVGKELGRASHRPTMPYNFRALNAVIANAYTFPAGSIGISRGLLLSMQSESELAGVLGHEVGHVASRHSAQRMSMGYLTQAAVAGVTLYVQHEDERYTDLAMGLGAVSAGALLARYSRSDEREADALGMEYMVKAGHNPKGMPDLMETLMQQERRTPSMFELLFATHPLTRERLDNVRAQMRSDYASAASLDAQRERYMDRTADLRKQGDAIRQMEKGQMAMAKKKLPQAETHLRTALKQAPDDYAGLILMSRCLAAQQRPKEAEAYARQAKRVAPREPQAQLLAGSLALQQGRPGDAIGPLKAYDRFLPNNPDVVFLLGLSHEQIGQRQPAARAFRRYAQLAPSGRQIPYVSQRLTEWQ